MADSTTDRNGPLRRLAPESLVDIVFAVVIGTGFFEFSDILLRPDSSFAAFFALIGVYTTVAWSWYGYHRSMDQHPYSTIRERHADLAGHARLVFDFLILVVYAFLLLSVHEIRTGLNPTRYAAAYPAIFLGYILSGLLRRHEYGAQASRMRLLLVMFAVYGAIGIGIGVWTSLDDAHEGLRTGLAVGGTLLVMAFYRLQRHVWGMIRGL